MAQFGYQKVTRTLAFSLVKLVLWKHAVQDPRSEVQSLVFEALVVLGLVTLGPWLCHRNFRITVKRVES